MYINRVVLDKIKGFEVLDLDLRADDGECEGWTVFTGDNGSGKTAFLRPSRLPSLALTRHGPSFRISGAGCRKEATRAQFRSKYSPIMISIRRLAAETPFSRPSGQKSGSARTGPLGK